MSEHGSEVAQISGVKVYIYKIYESGHNILTPVGNRQPHRNRKRNCNHPLTFVIIYGSFWSGFGLLK